MRRTYSSSISIVWYNTISTSSSVSSSGRLPAAKHSPACKTRRPNA
nr:MAG TPA: hypothetical protein [Caudoviricetes sp.]